MEPAAEVTRPVAPRGRPGELLPPRGFTLLELTVVLLLLAVVIALLVPRLGDAGEYELRRQARTLAGALSLLAEEAALTGRALRVSISLDAQSLELEALDEGGAYVTYGDSLFDSMRIAPPVQLSAVGLGDGSPVRDGEVQLHFFPGGTTEEFRLVLVGSKGLQCTVRFDPVLERAVLEGGAPCE
jgi:general secretion pathway protein H